jgi:hypothetical protein
MSKKQTLPKHTWLKTHQSNPCEDGVYKCQVESGLGGLAIIDVEFKNGKWKYPLKVFQWEVPFDLCCSQIKTGVKVTKAYWKHRV